MLPRRVILRFTCLLVVFYVLLMIPWPGWERTYGGIFRSFGDVVFRRFWFWSDGYVRFLDHRSLFLKEDIDNATPGKLKADFKVERPNDVQDTLMLTMNRRVAGTFGQLSISSRIVGYWPTAWLIALILAKPMPWPRRGWALLWGLLLIHMFIAFRLSLSLAIDRFGADRAYSLFHLSPFWKDVLVRAETVFVVNPTVSFVVPTFIWLIVSVRWSEWTALRDHFRGAAEDE